jgi:hypothetical protein
MSERHLPPSPGRLALARRAGLFAAARRWRGRGASWWRRWRAAMALERMASGAAQVATAAWSQAGQTSSRDAWAGAMRVVVARGDVVPLVGSAMVWVVAAGLIGGVSCRWGRRGRGARAMRGGVWAWGQRSRGGGRAAAVACTLGPLAVAGCGAVGESGGAGGLGHSRGGGRGEGGGGLAS